MTAPLQREDALYIRDVLELAGRYLRNPWRHASLAPGIAAACADGASPLTSIIEQKKDN